jgi:pimeloyl-ACP methyl ester carboxylesterase
VLDAADVDYPALVGISEGGPMSLVFAATYPDRVRSLLLIGTTARFSQDLPDRPWGFTPEQIAAGYDDIENHWGEGALAELFFGPVADIPGVREMWGREQRASASPMMARLMWQAVAEIDVRGVLDSVRTPTLVMGAGATGSRPSNPQRSWPRGFRTPTCANCRRANTMRQTWSSCFHGQPSNSLGSKRMRCLPSGC